MLNTIEGIASDRVGFAFISNLILQNATAFIEHGPIYVSPNGSFSANRYAWNRVANVLYLESPVFVGHSYHPTASVMNWTYNDATTAEANFVALQSFFQKFPHLVDNDFYLAGESYAGK